MADQVREGIRWQLLVWSEDGRHRVPSAQGGSGSESESSGQVLVLLSRRSSLTSRGAGCGVVRAVDVPLRV